MKFEDILACPICKKDLIKKKSSFDCVECKRSYQIYDNIPIMLDKSFSTVPDPLKIKPQSKINKIIDKFTISSLTLNSISSKNYSLIKNLLKNKKNPKVLMIGGGIKSLGKGTLSLGSEIINNSINLEIAKGPKVDIIGDGHDLPFKNNSFDSVIIQAVLEHVKDSSKVVMESNRVLKKGGYVYADIPFIQQLHGYPYDYRRFTIFGIEELFSNFKKIKSGVSVGPTSAFLVITKEFIALSLSFNSNLIYNGIKGVLGWLFYPFKYLDYIFSHYKNSRSIASAVYFLGEK